MTDTTVIWLIQWVTLDKIALTVEKQKVSMLFIGVLFVVISSVGPFLLSVISAHSIDNTIEEPNRGKDVLNRNWCQAVVSEALKALKTEKRVWI